MASSSNYIESNPITLIIQGHGSENTDIGLIANRVQLLSVSGAPGEYGLMGICNHNNIPLDINVMDRLKDTYSDPGLQSMSHHIMFNEILGYVLEDEYTKCNIFFEKNGGFTLTQPISERTFYFKPNPHENCEKCIYGEGSNKCERCIPIRKDERKQSPEYGLTIISTEIPYTQTSDEYRFSLIGNDRKKANLHMNLTTRNYWKQKIPITSIESINNFEKMFHENEIDLSELLTIFRDMGYQDIYIIDPTCRDCATSNPTRARKHWLTAFEQVLYDNSKEKREAYTMLGNTRDIITYNRTPQNNRNSITARNTIQEPKSIYLFSVSTGITIALTMFIAVLASMSMHQSGGRKTYKNKKRIFSTLVKKGVKSKNTRYNCRLPIEKT
jgi:hypothetical protein